MEKSWRRVGEYLLDALTPALGLSERGDGHFVFEEILGVNDCEGHFEVLEIFRRLEEYCN